MNGFTSDGTIINRYWGIVAKSTSKALSNVSAINRALASASQNGLTLVKFAKNTYYVDGKHDRVYSVSDKSIQIPSNITFDLGSSTLIQVANDKPGYAIFTIVGSSNVTIRNGILVGDKLNHVYIGAPASTHEYGFGIDIRGGINVSLISLNIYNMTGDSVLIGGISSDLNSVSKDVIVMNCKLHDNRRQGLSIMGAVNGAITANEIYNIGNVGGTDPMCGIDLENEVGWPIDSVRISGNRFYNNKKADVMIHRGATNTLIDDNAIDGGIALVYGDRTTIDNNDITNGGIFAIDTAEPLHTIISDNRLANSNIEILRNLGTVISGNTINEGIIKLNYASGAIYKNKISNSVAKPFAIQVYSDAQAGEYIFNAYIFGNEIVGTYTKQMSIASYVKLIVSYDEAQTLAYMNEFLN